MATFESVLEHSRYYTESLGRHTQRAPAHCLQVPMRPENFIELHTDLLPLY